tara:strand:+ start:113 stop:814 length:702 start_codon:yes stop_codon:yes gene_type:complete
MISEKYKFIFIHVYKTGGVSIQSSILNTLKSNVFNNETVSDLSELGCKIKTLSGRGREDRSHITASTYRHLLLKENRLDVWNNYFKFAFIRNPWDRLVSLYFHNMKNNEVFRKKYDSDVFVQKSFNKFLLKYTSNKKISNKILIKGFNYGLLTNIDWISNSSREPIIDFVGRFENLQEDFDVICKKTGMPKQKLPHENKTNHKHYTEYYNEETKGLVAQKYAKDIEYFGYEFK